MCSLLSGRYFMRDFLSQYPSIVKDKVVLPGINARLLVLSELCQSNLEARRLARFCYGRFSARIQPSSFRPISRHSVNPYLKHLKIVGERSRGSTPTVVEFNVAVIPRQRKCLGPSSHNWSCATVSGSSLAYKAPVLVIRSPRSADELRVRPFSS